MNIPRILVCGNRDWTCRLTIVESLQAALFVARQRCEKPIFGANVLLIHGACGKYDGRGMAVEGADIIAAQVAEVEFEWLTRAYPANWEAYGNAAGPIRNQDMLEDGNPHVCAAFGDLVRRGKRTGTGDMVDRCLRAGIPTLVIPRSQ